MIKEADSIRESVLEVAKLMVAAAKTAPKARGVDNIVSVVLDKREELEALAAKMEELANVYGDFFKRDANNVRNSDAVVLIGCKVVEFKLTQPPKWPCTADLANSLVNLGIALGSAVKVASIMNIDNRIMFSIGVAAQELGFIDADVVYGIPLSARAKNIYFDRRA
jgi:uncharacterized ferredoxin-like protein